MLSFAHNIAEFERALSIVAERQIPFATAQALNDTAVEVDDAWKVQLSRRLDRPTPFTKRGTYRKRASKGRLTAEVGFKPIQSRYLRLQVEGGERRPAGRAIPIPVAQRLNKYGNMPKGAIKRAVARKDTFVGKVGRVGGVFKRPAKSKRKTSGPVLLVSFQSKARYEPRLDLQTIAQRRASAQFPRHFVRSFKAAMASAR